VSGVVQSSQELSSDKFSPARYRELICEAYVGTANAQFVDGVWRARQYHEEDYDDEEIEDLTRMIFEDAAKMGGIYGLEMKLELTGELQERIGWADAPLQAGDLVAARCLDEIGGALVILRREGKGYLEVGGMYGGVHAPIASLPRRKVLLVS